jgi:hypothetical protein
MEGPHRPKKLGWIEWWALQDSNLSRIAGVSADRRNPERIEGPSGERNWVESMVGAAGFEPATSTV